MGEKIYIYEDGFRKTGKNYGKEKQMPIFCFYPGKATHDKGEITENYIQKVKFIKKIINRG